MAKKLIMALALLSAVLPAWAQDDAWMGRLEQLVTSRRDHPRDRGDWEEMVKTLTDPNRPLVVLLDNLSSDSPESESRAPGTNPMRVDGAVTRAYGARRGVATSKGDFYNSLERGVNYSMIEKTVASGKTVKYSLTGHSGRQEFVIVPYEGQQSPLTFRFAVNGTPQSSAVEKSKIVRCNIATLKPTDTVTLTVENGGGREASFVIINHNTKK